MRTAEITPLTGRPSDSRIVAAVVQATPAYLDPRQSIDRAVTLIGQASRDGASLVVFPELFLSGYPNWINLNDPSTASYGAAFFTAYLDAALSLPDPRLTPLLHAAREHRCRVVIGIAEAPRSNRGPLYNSALIVPPDGSKPLVHRKLCPVKHELLYFARGASDDVFVAPSPLGNLGIAICAENWLTPYRHALSMLAEEIHCSLWVNLPRLRHLVDASAITWSMEVGTFTIVACQVGKATGVDFSCDYTFIGGSSILGPDGVVLAGPVYDVETILLAELDLSQLSRAAATFSLAGKDGRSDIFELRLATEVRNQLSPASLFQKTDSAGDFETPAPVPKRL